MTIYSSTYLHISTMNKFLNLHLTSDFTLHIYISTNYLISVRLKQTTLNGGNSEHNFKIILLSDSSVIFSKYSRLSNICKTKANHIIWRQLWTLLQFYSSQWSKISSVNFSNSEYILLSSPTKLKYATWWKFNTSHSGVVILDYFYPNFKFD